MTGCLEFCKQRTICKYIHNFKDHMISGHSSQCIVASDSVTWHGTQISNQYQHSVYNLYLVPY